MIPKFRAWHTKLKEFVRPDKYCQITSDGEIIGADVVLMQSTGLFDSTGTEMFEGDIVIIKVPDAMYFIRRFDDMCLGFGDVSSFDRKTNITYDTYEHGFPMEKQIRIIGNCYQHPALLEKTA
jgi:uncharacterized phage protein (TIGR01671 family)